MIPHENILISIKTQSVEDVITMENGKQERSGVTGDLQDVVKSTEGEKIVRIQVVIHLKF
jgi:hypothetical protein